MKRGLKAVIPAAGVGTRTLPATKSVPKELLPLGERPGIQHIMEEICTAGISEVGIIISKGKEAVVQHFQSDPELDQFLAAKQKQDLLSSVAQLQDKLTFHTIYQDQPKGLGHAVLCAKEFVGQNDFVVLLPDDIIFHQPGCTAQMVEINRQHKRAVVALEEVPWERVSSYGIVSGSQLEKRVWALNALVEKPPREKAPSNLSVTGRYLLPAEIFSILEGTKPGAGGEIQLTDALNLLAQRDRLVGYQFEGERVDLGTTAGFVWANLRYLMRQPQLVAEIEDRFGKLPFSTDTK